MDSNYQSEGPPIAAAEIKIHVDGEDDSGLDNASDSGGSCDDDRKQSSYSSTDSLDVDPPFMKTSLSMRAKVQTFLDGERFYPKKNDLPPTCPHRSNLKQELPEALLPHATSHSVAVLHIDTTVLETNNNDEQEIDLDKLPGYFQELWLGKIEAVDYDQNIQTKPPWLNDEKFKRGQKFAQDHLFCINYAEMVSLYLIFGLKTALQPLIFTGRSHTPFKAFQRYLSTLTRLMTWYEGDPWSEGSMSRRNMEVVRMMHKNVYQKLNSATCEELRRRVTLGDDNSDPIWSTSRKFLLEDFQSSCPVPVPGSCPHAGGAGVWVNQYDMAVTQFAFVGLAVTFPKDFGIHQATDEDLDAFVHLWRGLGYQLGIKDQFNFCNGNLDDIRQRTVDFINLALKPSLRELSADWEHMSRCLTEGIAYYVPGVNFEVSLKHVCSILHIHTPRLSKNLTYWQSFMYGVVTFTFQYLFRLPGMLAFNNNLLRRAIEKAQKASQETLTKWEMKDFPYMKQSNKEPVDIL